MKKIIVLVLAISIAGNLCAQGNTADVALSNTDKTFELPVNTITRRFCINLGKGNKVKLELTAMEDLEHIRNIDSIVKTFLHDVQPLKDSLGDELVSKRIDYAVDSMGRKKLRIQQFPPKGSSFLVDGTDVAALKLEQDTINIIGSFRGNPMGILSKKIKIWHYYRISFFVNRFADMAGYLNGSLDEKIVTLEKNKRSDWGLENDGLLHYGKDASITARQPQGYFAGNGDYLNIGASMSLQNYKNYFVPSFNVYTNFFINTAHRKLQFGAMWEPQFLFAKNSAGNLQTNRNDFVSLAFGSTPSITAAPDNGPHFYFLNYLSVGYLVRQKGDFYDPHTFRIGTGAIKWKGEKLKLEPIFYFHDLFKNVTPGLRLSVNF